MEFEQEIDVERLLFDDPEELNWPRGGVDWNRPGVYARVRNVYLLDETTSHI